MVLKHMILSYGLLRLSWYTLVQTILNLVSWDLRDDQFQNQSVKHQFVEGTTRMYQARVLGACLHINGFAVVKIDEEKGEVMETFIKQIGSSRQCFSSICDCLFKVVLRQPSLKQGSWYASMFTLRAFIMMPTHMGVADIAFHLFLFNH
ncbi:hypothetical protein NC653_034965 [Populus alba x Populus x berolinensis]|uniref:Uncharacterized protein n=1 Tax=Populus alba x Populus x berolinensis TaxID=444605 RepID=A0AAD6LP50_9ROSI|nr:hypothetical protein NC653_034965 [Populus alba x Populus x berolinensis]